MEMKNLDLEKLLQNRRSITPFIEALVELREVYAQKELKFAMDVAKTKEMQEQIRVDSLNKLHDTAVKEAYETAMQASIRREKFEESMTMIMADNPRFFETNYWSLGPLHIGTNY